MLEVKGKLIVDENGDIWFESEEGIRMNLMEYYPIYEGYGANHFFKNRNRKQVIEAIKDRFGEEVKI